MTAWGSWRRNALGWLSAITLRCPALAGTITPLDALSGLHGLRVVQCAAATSSVWEGGLIGLIRINQDKAQALSDQIVYALYAGGVTASIALARIVHGHAAIKRIR